MSFQRRSRLSRPTSTCFLMGILIRLTPGMSIVCDRFEVRLSALERLVMNLLTLSMGKGKILELKKEKIFIQDIISNAMSQLNEDIAKKNINVILNVEAHLPAIDADPTKLSIAVLNLLDNAVKFNKSNGIIRISASQLKSKSIGVAISDTGIGIPEDKIEEIYSPFTQVDMSSTREHQGTGLGLAVAKNYY